MTKSFYLNISMICCIIIIKFADCTTHWKVTESGRIEEAPNSIYTIQRPNDLAIFLKQDERHKRMTYIKKLLAINRDEINKSNLNIKNFKEDFLRTDGDCVKARIELVKYSFYESYLLNLDADENREFLFSYKIYENEIEPNKIDRYLNKPICNVNLPFTMYTFDHLESLQKQDEIEMKVDEDVAHKLDLKNVALFGHYIQKKLKSDPSSTKLMLWASYYFRLIGDFKNTAACLQRVIYFSTKESQTNAMISLSNVVHKLQFINDSLAIALSAYRMNPNAKFIPYYIGNIYVTMGDLNTSILWYERLANSKYVYQTNGQLRVHAILCHQKLEKSLLDKHNELQNKLIELKDYQILSDEYVELVNKVNSEISSEQRRAHTKAAYENLMKNAYTIVCKRDKYDDTKQLKCSNVSTHYSVTFRKEPVFRDKTDPFEIYVYDFKEDDSMVDTGDFNYKKILKSKSVNFKSASKMENNNVRKKWSVYRRSSSSDSDDL